MGVLVLRVLSAIQVIRFLRGIRILKGIRVVRFMRVGLARFIAWPVTGSRRDCVSNKKISSLNSLDEEENMSYYMSEKIENEPRK